MVNIVWIRLTDDPAVWVVSMRSRLVTVEKVMLGNVTREVGIHRFLLLILQNLVQEKQEMPWR